MFQPQLSNCLKNSLLMYKRFKLNAFKSNLSVSLPPSQKCLLWISCFGYWHNSPKVLFSCSTLLSTVTFRSPVFVKPVCEIPLFLHCRYLYTCFGVTTVRSVTTLTFLFPVCPPIFHPLTHLPAVLRIMFLKSHSSLWASCSKVLFPV